MKSQIFRVVFEDSEVMIIEKLAPFLSQRGDQGDGEGLYEFISRTQGIKLIPVHRLDRDVLGLMVFTKTAKAAEELSRQFKEREIRKGYEATVQGRVHKDSDTLVHFLKKNPKNNHVTVYPNPAPDAKRAELSYVVLERGDKWSRLFIWLKTGRSHQIRAQLSKIGHAILGDVKYSKQKVDPASEPCIQLRSAFLEFSHPTEGEKMSFSLVDESVLERAREIVQQNSL